MLVKTAVQRCSYLIPFEFAGITGLAFSADASRLALGRSDGTLEIRAADDGFSLERVLTGEGGVDFRALCWSGE
jgi:hypothetical protein